MPHKKRKKKKNPTPKQPQKSPPSNKLEGVILVEKKDAWRDRGHHSDKETCRRWEGVATSNGVQADSSGVEECGKGEKKKKLAWNRGGDNHEYKEQLRNRLGLEKRIRRTV